MPFDIFFSHGYHQLDTECEKIMHVWWWIVVFVFESCKHLHDYFALLKSTMWHVERFPSSMSITHSGLCEVSFSYFFTYTNIYNLHVHLRMYIYIYMHIHMHIHMICTYTYIYICDFGGVYMFHRFWKDQSATPVVEQVLESFLYKQGTVVETVVSFYKCCIFFILVRIWRKLWRYASNRHIKCLEGKHHLQTTNKEPLLRQNEQTYKRTVVPCKYEWNLLQVKHKIHEAPII